MEKLTESFSGLIDKRNGNPDRNKEAQEIVNMIRSTGSPNQRTSLGSIRKIRSKRD